MEHILGQQYKDDDESVYSHDRFAQVYSNDQESVLSNGQFKALDSVDYSEKGRDDDDDYVNEELDERALLNDIEEREYFKQQKRGRHDEELDRCGSNDSTSYYQSGNVCVDCFMETFQIMPKDLVIKVLVSVEKHKLSVDVVPWTTIAQVSNHNVVFNTLQTQIGIFNSFSREHFGKLL